MEIRFDPLNEREAHAVAMFLDRDTPRTAFDMGAASIRLFQQSHGVAPMTSLNPEQVAAVLAEPAADPLHSMSTFGEVASAERDLTWGAATAEHLAEEAAVAVSAAPLAPEADAPLPAAADLFATAPAVPSPGQASTAIVPPPPAVPAPPPVAVPTAPAAETNPAGVDKNGLPWDARIHSGTKAVNADGSWRQRRGLNDPALVARVEEELRGLLAIASHPGISTEHDEPEEAAAPAPVLVPPPPAMPGNVPPPPPVTPVPPSSPPATALIPSPPAVPAPPTVAAPGAPITFAELMTRITKAIREGKVTEAQINAGLVTLGLKEGEMGMLAGKVDLRSQMADYVATLLESV